MGNHCYVISKTARPPELQGLWDGPLWGEAPFLSIDCFRPEGAFHLPLVQCKMLYDDSNLYGLFHVRDRYVRCVHTDFQSPVYDDSCVEFFIQPRQDRGYFNFEFNCGGALLVSYVTNPTRVDGQLTEFKLFSPEECRLVAIYHTFPSIVEPEIEEEVTWLLGFSIPFILLQSYVGKIGEIEGREWRGNLYKCGNKTSHPHWASWAPLRDRNFHAPWDFGVFRFAP